MKCLLALSCIALVGLTGCGYTLTGPDGVPIVTLPPAKPVVVVPAQTVAVSPQVVYQQPTLYAAPPSYQLAK